MAIKHVYSFIKDQFKLKGWKLIEDTYVNSKYPMICECPLGHLGLKTYRDLQQDRGCIVCCGRESITIDKVKKELAKIGYMLINNKYVSSSIKMECLCIKGHLYLTSWDNFREGRRCPICYKESRTGKTNSNWRGGTSFESYCPIWSDKGYKADIKERDNNICQNPYCFKTTKKLHIHHIDYNKYNCQPSNLITVCGSCNSRANKDREWHTEWYQTIMNKKFGYVYE
ncbi:HNH endonuclease [bacterium]|nr:HNH endonuclease [bacterium]